MGIHWRGEHIAGIFSSGAVPSLYKLGNVALAVRDDPKAERYYRRALQILIDQSFVELKLDILVRHAMLLIRKGNPERAVELVVLALYHPASVRETQDRAQGLLDKLRAELPPAVFAAAQARGRARELESTMEELLAELKE
jgi:hypothetical protein